MTRLFLMIYSSIVLSMAIVVCGIVLFVGGAPLPGRNGDIELTLGPALRKMAAALAATAPGSQARLNTLRSFQSETGPTLALLDPEGLPLTRAQTDRLFAGEVVVEGTEWRRFAYAALPGEQRILEWELYGLGTYASQWMGVSAAEHPATDVSAIHSLSKPERDRLSYRPILAKDGRILRLPAKARPSGSEPAALIALQMPAPVKGRWIIPAAFLLLIAVANLLVLIRPHRQLRRISEVAQAFSKGELSLRSSLKGSGAIADLGRQVDRMVDRVSTLLERNEELLRAVAHELRTPVARLFLLVDLLEKEGSKEERSRSCASMRTALAELRTLTDELVTYARTSAEGPALSLEACSPEEIIEGALVLHGDPRVRVQHPENPSPALLICDRRLMVRALGNLVSNACSSASAKIEVAWSTPGDGFLFSVEDDGEGIAPHERARILQPFERIGAQDAGREGGLGIGLAVVQRIMQRHRGSIFIGTARLGGARVELRLPQAAAELQAGP